MTQPEQPVQPAPPGGVMTAAQIKAETDALGKEATTERTERQYFDIADGEGGFRHVNAWGEEKGSAEDKKRPDKASSAP